MLAEEQGVRLALEAFKEHPNFDSTEKPEGEDLRGLVRLAQACYDLGKVESAARLAQLENRVPVAYTDGFGVYWPASEKRTCITRLPLYASPKGA